MNILVIGGAGFQGSHLVEALVAKRHKVSVLNTPSDEALHNLSNVKNHIRTIWGSITDSEIVDKSIRGQDVVFHLAAYISVDESLTNPERTLHTNIMGTVNILNAIRKYKIRLIYVSSCEVYGDGHLKNEALAESAEMRPNSPYAASKAAADRICFAYYKSFGLDITIIRPFNIFGERQKGGKYGALIPILVRKAMNGDDLTVFGGGNQTRNYTYISDIVRAYELVLERSDLNGRVINFASFSNVKIIDIATYIADKFGVKIKHLPSRLGEVSRFEADTTIAKSLGWEAKTSIWEGIDKYINWVKGSEKKVM